MNSLDILEKMELSPEQLASLKGGIDPVGPTDPGTDPRQVNRNKVENCVCEYHSPDADNKNKATGCGCHYVPGVNKPVVGDGGNFVGSEKGIAEWLEP